MHLEKEHALQIISEEEYNELLELVNENQKIHDEFQMYLESLIEIEESNDDETK